MANLVRTSSNSPVCANCLGDNHLKQRVTAEGTIRKCAFCGKRGKSFSIAEVSALVEEILEENFELSESWHEEVGDFLYSIVGDMLDAPEPVVNAVISDLTAISYREAKHGGEPRWDAEANYVERNWYPHEHEWNWDELRDNLTHRARFFNNNARAFFKYLIDGLKDLRVVGMEGEAGIRVIKPDKKTVFYRARRADDPGQLQKILDAPQLELGPPPPKLASTGRMNPEGVSVFYGGLDRETCVAELRPPIKGTVVTGGFRLRSPVRLLDFRLLEDAYHNEPLSYFQPDFKSKVERREFVRTLHSKIRQPILPGKEREYLVTQALAEYLAILHKPAIDGVLFTSAQRNKGVNIALFGHVLDIQLDTGTKLVMGKTSVLEGCTDDIQIHRIKSVEYESVQISAENSTAEICFRLLDAEDNHLMRKTTIEDDS
jgi:RES domain